MSLYIYQAVVFFHPFTHSLSLLCEPRHNKTNKMSMRPAKTQISLGIRPVWSESSLSAWRKLGSWAIHWAHYEDSDQTGRMPRLIWVFAGRTVILSCRGSCDSCDMLKRQEKIKSKCFEIITFNSFTQLSENQLSNAGETFLFGPFTFSTNQYKSYALIPKLHFWNYYCKKIVMAIIVDNNLRCLSRFEIIKLIIC